MQSIQQFFRFVGSDHSGKNMHEVTYSLLVLVNLSSHQQFFFKNLRCIHDKRNRPMNAGFAKRKYNYLASQDSKISSNDCPDEMFFVICIGGLGEINFRFEP